MRGFIILCFAAVAVAAPQGYNYSPSGGQQQSVGFAGNSLGSSGIGGGGQHQTYSPQQQAVVSKRFYIHSAPEENDDEYKERHITVGVPKKNYNVVFIKSPQRSNKKSVIRITPSINEEKTVIYVLNKKSDTQDIQAEVIENASPTTKPEVYFIKYKTNEEANHAQSQIQAQYDALGGSTQVSDEGFAPVSSVIGSLGGGSGGGSNSAGGLSGGSSSGSFTSVSSASNGGSGSQGSSSSYLPPTA